MNIDRFSGLLSAVGIVFVIVLVAWLGIAGPLWRAAWTARPSEWLGFSGAITAAFIVALAICWARRGIVRQMRAALMSREEDRIESELPGLRDADEKVSTIVNKIGDVKSPAAIITALRAHSISETETQVEADIKTLLPYTGDSVRRQIGRLICLLIISARKAHAAEHKMTKANNELEAKKPFDPVKHQSVLQAAKEARQACSAAWKECVAERWNLYEYHLGMKRRISALEGRLPFVRREIERTVHRQ